MKSILFLFTFLIGLQIVNAQYVTIPDNNFRQALKELYPTCFNSDDMMDTTCIFINYETILSVESKNIVSLEGIQYFKNLRNLIIGYNRLISIPTLPPSLKHLSCPENRLLSLPPLPVSLESLQCNVNLLTSLPELPPMLKYLYCAENKLKNLPVLPHFINEINCGWNQLESLPTLTESISFLECSNNKLMRLPELPEALRWLYCRSNRLITLPTIPPDLQYLYCYDNLLTTMPALNSIYGMINCSNNKLIILPELHENLESLLCSNNKLSSLPKLPKDLKELSCENNEIRHLPELPLGLQALNCSYNCLVSLPILCSTLTSLNCSHNQITTLPAIPVGLQGLDCAYNQLSELLFPQSAPSTYLYCNNNPLRCLPILPERLWQLTLKNTQVLCIPNVLPYIGYVDTILPICSSASAVCAANPFVQGLVYNDINNDSIFDLVSEQLIAQQNITVLPNNWLGLSDFNGSYWLKLDTAINNIWSAINNYRYATITPAFYSKNPTDSLGLLSGSYDFGVHFTPNVKDLETTLSSSPARPGFTTNVTVTTNNVGTINQSEITIKLKYPIEFNVLSTSISPTSIINDTLIWNNININYLEHQSINIQFQVPVNAVLGDNAVYEAWSNGTQSDTTPIDNYLRWTETIRGSFDPNDKLVNRTSLPPTYNPDKDRLLYTIRFQNTGTDTAFTIIVRDEIPTNLDVTSLRVVNASHPYQLIAREKNIVEVAFPNIQLPDSNTNEAKSHGFVQLEFKPKSGLSSNTDINNNASILFDYNVPVVTNTASTKIQITLSTGSNKKLSFKLFPNPVSEIISVEFPYDGKYRWYLTDISGKIIKQNNIENNTNAFDINVKDLANGTYLLSLEMNDIISSSKIVITR